MKIKTLVLIFILLISVSASAQWDYGFDFSKAGSAGLQFLKIGVGARECGMGEAALSASRGINSIFWNPAGIAYVEGTEATFSHTGWLMDIDMNAAAIGTNISGVGVVGLSVIYMGVPDFEETTVQMQDGTGRMVSANDLAIGLAVARRFSDKLSMGLQLRYVREKLDQDSFSNVLFDLGANYVTGFRNLQISVCAQHFGPDIKMLRDTFRMPLWFKIGLSDDLFRNDFNQLTLNIDLVHPTDNTERMNFGVEYGFFDSVFFRGGYRMNSDLGEFAFGAGVKQTLIGVTGRIDYSYSDYGDIFGAVNRLSVSFDL